MSAATHISTVDLIRGLVGEIEDWAETSEDPDTFRWLAEGHRWLGNDQQAAEYRIIAEKKAVAS